MSDREKQSQASSDLVARAASVHASSELRKGVTFWRAWNIFKYYSKSQLARRAISVATKRIGFPPKTPPPSEPLELAFRDAFPFDRIRKIRSCTSYRQPDSVRRQLGRGGVEVLNQWQPLNWRMDSQSEQTKEKSLLWQFQLHYHEYLLPLACDPNADETQERKLNLSLIEKTIVSWLDANRINNQKAHIDAWHPYCISRRLPVWFCLLTLDGLSVELRERMQQSAHLQAQHLSENLEWELRGNHLLENIRALSLAGSFFDTSHSNRWVQQVHQILPAQIDEQVLSHGEHFERCPMYHCQILGNFLEMLIACKPYDPKLARILESASQKMFGFLIDIVHPDGEIPLLGDSCFGEAPSVDCIGQLAEEANLEIAENDTQTEKPSPRVGDYWIHRNQGDYLIFDRGQAGADTLPAHAHCDLLTMESSIAGVRWLVDGGIYNYEDDEMRWYCRSSLAHNVVCVDDQNQFDVWSKFRMGYRGWPNDIAEGVEGEFSWATASHNAYRRLGISKTWRLLGIQPNQFLYCVDRLESDDAISPGESKNQISGFLHLGPEVKVTKINTHVLRLDFAGNSYDITFFLTDSIRKVESWYCPEFGKKVNNTAIEYRFANDTKLAGWLMVPSLSTNNSSVGLPSLKVKRQNRVDQISISNASEEIIHTFDWTT